MNLHDLVRQAADLGLSARPLRLELDEIRNLRVPCILHWDLNHFVVLKKIRRGTIIVLDPAFGERQLSLSEFSSHFTGVAIELDVRRPLSLNVAPIKRIALKELVGSVKGVKRSLLQLLVLAAALELFSILSPLLQQIVVDEVVSSGDRSLLGVITFGFFLLLIIQVLIGLGRSWMLVNFQQDVSLQWASNVFAHLIRLPPQFFEKRALGDISSRFSSIETIRGVLTTVTLGGLLDGVMAIASIVLMFVYSAGLAAITLSAAAAYALLRWFAYTPIKNASAEHIVSTARERSHFLETLRCISPIKLFGREEERRSRWQNLLVEIQNRELRISRMNIFFSTASTLLFGVENIVVIWLGAAIVMDGGSAGGKNVGTMSLGMLFAFLTYKAQFLSRVSAMIDHAVEVKMLALHAGRLADICLEAPENDIVPPSNLSHLPASIELKSVSFRYGDGEPWLLKGANLKIEPGESVALIGTSGAGKTTLVKIALGLLRPSEGEVLYGGQPIGHLGINNFRRQIGTVMQEDSLLTGSLAENIAFFDLEMDLAKVEASARVAQLHDDICRMPMGYQTLVGDLGSGLSGGQRQRLMLARALYKQPRVLALDEATSHLDVESERALNIALSQLRLTRIIVAHRPETISGAHRVVNLHNGELTEVILSRPSRDEQSESASIAHHLTPSASHPAA